MQRRRQQENAQRPPSTRERVLAAIPTARGHTLKQILATLGSGFDRPAVYYHIRRLVDDGLVIAKRVKNMRVDRSWYRYRRVR